MLEMAPACNVAEEHQDRTALRTQGNKKRSDNDNDEYEAVGLSDPLSGTGRNRTEWKSERRLDTLDPPRQIWPTTFELDSGFGSADPSPAPVVACNLTTAAHFSFPSPTIQSTFNQWGGPFVGQYQIPGASPPESCPRQTMGTAYTGFVNSNGDSAGLGTSSTREETQPEYTDPQELQVSPSLYGAYHIVSPHHDFSSLEANAGPATSKIVYSPPLRGTRTYFAKEQSDLELHLGARRDSSDSTTWSGEPSNSFDSTVWPKGPSNLPDSTVWSRVPTMGSIRSRDSGYASDSHTTNRRVCLNPRRRHWKPQKFRPKTCNSPFSGSFDANSDELEKAASSQSIKRLTPIEFNEHADPSYRNDGSCGKGGTSAMEDSSEQAVGPRAIARSPVIDAAAAYTEDADEDMNLSRSPSPWQSADSAESDQALWSILIALHNGMDSPQSTIDGSPDNRGTNSPVTPSAMGNTTYTAADEPSSSLPSSSGPTTSVSNNIGTGSTTTGGKRMVRSGDTRRDSDDGDENEPNPKRLKPATPQERLPSPRRFACPYQKYDPFGSPFCLMASNKNPEGGANTFARVKYAVSPLNSPKSCVC